MESIERALLLVERIYEAAVQPDAWHDFVAELSEALGGAAVQMSLRLPRAAPTPDAYYHTGLDPAYHAAFVKHALEGLPWGSLDNEVFRGRFGRAREVITAPEVSGTPFYLDFMRPQGLAAEWPICHLIQTHEGTPIAGIAIYRREGDRPIVDADLELLDSLVAHLSRAYAVHARLTNASHERSALAEVIDHLPVGVILLDSAGRSVLRNRSADGILALRDGFCLEGGRPCAMDPGENRRLRALLASAASDAATDEDSGAGVMSLSRPSGRRGFSVWVGSLRSPAPRARRDEASAILFVADAETDRVSTNEVLQHLYRLTPAEADLVRRISSGQSLEQVAEKRGVTMNTVRSQLKQVFCKTDTSRQGELVHLVLTGIAAIRSDESPDSAS